ncbi:DUF4249 domain-containing protein [Mongoliibacter ruber]|uniref:Uncharacterized protein DUF4249 n=1 Tax=Mongoliibacter ruber TaxID=1750599 RepID=A0A2T0WHJ3_9BACT|nr:DUF4249 domain-containing protein [Mongoliibacter ruber]PRY86180.1 uncharacterized protein DUF4249 [Mongoliibacter ruber]
MKNYSAFILTFLVGLLFSTCIDPYHFESERPEWSLGMEGFITTLPKAHRIRLSRVDRFSPDFNGLNRPETLAKVLIKDDLGNVEVLTETTAGVYLTHEDFAAKIGRSYNLEILLNNGKRFISRPEIVVAAPIVDSLSYRSVKTATSNAMIDEVGVRIFAHFQDPPDERNFYFWNMQVSDFQMIAEPELNLNSPFHPTCPRCPNPLDCCRVCYYSERPSPPNVNTAEDSDFNGVYQNMPIAYIKDNGLRFKGIYKAKIQHLSVSQEAYRHLKLVGQQLSLTGTVFDPPPANIRGNLISLDEPDDQPLGFFFASDEIELETYIHPDRLEFLFRPQTLFPTDCRSYVVGIGITKPNDPTAIPADWKPN